MLGQRIRCAAGIAVCVAITGATGCASSAANSPAASTSFVGPVAAAGSSTAAPRPPSAAPDSLAPAGPGPGRQKEEAEHQPPAVSALTVPTGCVDLEAQSHVPAVDSQFSCRRGTERVYVMTFRTTADRDTYLAGTQVVNGGFNIVGPTWVVHVEQDTTAQSLAAQLKGTVRPGS